MSCSVHDVANLEGAGVPSVFVASNAFVDAAEVQGADLGFQAPRVFVAHPIQDRTDDELRALADGAFDSLLAQLCAPDVGPSSSAPR